MLHCSRIVPLLYLPASRSLSLLNKNSLMFCKFLHFITAPLPSSATALKRVFLPLPLPHFLLPDCPHWWQSFGRLMECNSQGVLIIHFPSARDVCLIHHLNLTWWKCPQKKASSISSHSSRLSFISVSLFKFSLCTARQSVVLFHSMTDAHTHVRSSVF